VQRPSGEWSKELQRAVVHTVPAALRPLVPSDHAVKGGVGFGRQAEVPWVSVLPPGVSGAGEGRYVVYLFAADGTGVYLSLSQAVTGRRKKDLARLADELRLDAGEQPDLLETIDLEVEGGLGEKYELATAYAVRYERGALPSQEDLEADVDRFVAMLAEADSAIERPPAWIFQANPDRYRIEEAIQEREEILWSVRQSVRSLAPDDRVYIWKSGRDAGIVAVGTVLDAPSLRPEDVNDPYWVEGGSFDEDTPRVRVSIDKVVDPTILRDDLRNHEVLSGLEILKIPRGTNFRVSSREDAALREILAERGAIQVEPGTLALPPVTDEVADRVYIPKPWLQEVFDLLLEKGQAIFYGPPGTGKTRIALELAKHAAQHGGQYRLVQFHPSYSYEDFVEGYRPAPADSGLDFVLRPGPLREIAEAAAEDPGRPYVLVIDEINRGNLPKIFGELLFLLEYRKEKVQLQYSPDDPFSLPQNLYLIGTMNTADRSIALVDAALRRRFYFKAFIPTEPPISDVLRRWLRRHRLDLEPARLLEELNRQIALEEVAIGPSYFMTPDGTSPDLERVWKYAILPLLEEYYYGSGRNVTTEFSLDRLRSLAETEVTASDPEAEVDEPAGERLDDE
jgi:MoxR-like ATPase